MKTFIHKTENGGQIQLDFFKSSVHVWRFNEQLSLVDDLRIENLEELIKFVQEY
jgi:hypothetical protein